MAHKGLSKFLKHTEIFADFGLAVASAAVHGLSSAVSTSPSDDDVGVVDTLIERTAQGLKVASSVVKRAADEAAVEIDKLHREQSNGHAARREPDWRERSGHGEYVEGNGHTRGDR
ncbi:MAG TPA: hypothetical protein VE987_09695 [Polyangiaceae bacterium]|nr:hypothetical protein [Polyangiaceae bacterium]